MGLYRKCTDHTNSNLRVAKITVELDRGSERLMT